MARLLRRSCLLLLGLLLGACDSTTAGEHAERAKQHLAQGEYRTAIIELKNALQKQPDDAEARRLLGEVHLRVGDYTGAHKELERALDLGLDSDRVRAGLLRAKVWLGNYQEVIGALEDRGELSPEFAVILGRAYLEAGDLQRAGAMFEQGRALSEGRLGLGLIAEREGDLVGAAQHLAEAVRLDPEHWEAWLYQGELELNRGRFDAARTAFDRAAALPASQVLGRAGLARTHLAENDLEAAEAEVQALRRLAPGFELGHYLEGLIRFQQQDLEAAEAAIREVQANAPDHLPSLYLMGAIKYGKRQFAQAEHSLKSYLGQVPDNASAAKLLASVRFDHGDFQGAADVLERFLAESRDAQLLALYGSAQLQLGDAGKAARALERSVELAPDMAAFRNQLALSLLASGDRDGAEAELASAIEVDGAQFQSDYLLAMLRVREGDWGAAGQAVEALVRKSPQSPIGYNLRGAVALGQQDRAAAREAFREALAQDAAFLPAVQNLARLEELEGRPDAAAELYRSYLNDHPGQEAALLSLADLAMRQRDTAAALMHLEEAVAADAAAVRSRVALSRLYLSHGRLKDAGELIEQALTSAPGFPDLLLLQAQVHLRSGHLAAANEVAATLQGQMAEGPDNPALLLALGRLQAELGQVRVARRNLERALALGEAPEPSVLQVLARLDLNEGNLGGARSRVAELERVAADAADTQLLKADLALAEGDREQALQIYLDLEQAGMRDAVIRLVGRSLEQGEHDAALKRLDAWLQKQPDDLGAQLLSADVVMRQDQQQAIARYERLVDTGNPVVLNNLAWLYLLQQDDRAVDTARLALQAAPANPDILDTLAWVLLKQNRDTREAVRLLRRSLQLNPDNPSVRYHLGIALRESGDLGGAREALTRALQDEPFPEAQEARQALASL